VIPVVVDVGSLGGATLVVCCEDEKWDGGKLGPFSYDKLVRLIVDKCVPTYHQHTLAPLPSR
jgi:acetyl-CoA carboxylase carboxyltransferase component